jgi:hypothetical protein
MNITVVTILNLFNLLYKLIRWIIGTVFICAGSVKLLEPNSFAFLIEAYGILPDSLLLPVAIFLPTLEVAAGIGLLFDIKGSLGLIAGLLGLFIVILGYGIWMGLDVDCGCWGPEDPESKAFHGLRSSLYRDVAMIAGAVLVYAWRRYRAIEPLRITVLINQLFQRRSPKDAFM